jgi:tetratricopeptide (TPR) repeat protein
LRLWKSWLYRGHLDEGERWLERALAVDDGAPASQRAIGLAVLGEFPRFRGDHERAITLKEDALATLRELGLARETTWVLCDIAESLATLGDLPGARRMVDEALDIQSRVDDPSAIRVRLSAADLAMRSGDFTAARERLEAVLDTVGESRFKMNHIMALVMLGDCLRKSGSDAEAGERYRQALTDALASHSTQVLPSAFEGSAHLLVPSSPSHAAILLGAADAIRASAGFEIEDLVGHTELVRSLEAQLGRHDLDAVRERASAMPAEEAAESALRWLKDPSTTT